MGRAAGVRAASAFVIDRVKALAPKHPEWQNQQPLKAVLDGDLRSVAASGEHGLLKLTMATHAGMTSEEFKEIVGAWLATAWHPQLNRRYTDLVYQPMLEFLTYLRVHGFKTYVVSGGGIEFVRVFSDQKYGIPPEQVIGSSIEARYEVRDGIPVIVRLPAVDFIDDKAGKPLGIHKFIGKRPIAAFGNSDGDFEMLEYATSGPGRRLGLIVHHDDPDREFAYDRASAIGRLDRPLDAAPQRGWIVVSTEDEWRTVYPQP